MIDVPYRNKKTGETDVAAEAIMWPRILFHALYNHLPTAFFSRIVPDVSIVEHFWKSVESTEHYMTHPVRHRANHMRKCVPIFLHADGVPCVGIGKSWSKMCDVWSWGSVLVTDGNTKASLFLIYAFYALLAIGEESYDAFWVGLVWSLKQLYTGKFSDEDMFGNKYKPGTLGYKRKGQFIAGGWFATLWIVEADLDFIHKRLGMRNCGALCPCSWCGADSDPLSVPWSDFRPLDAKWLQQIYDKAQFLVALGPDRNPLLELPGVSQHTFWLDYMRCKYMGVDQFFLQAFWS